MQTLYNHKTIESDQKPLIPNIEFKHAIDRLKSGDDVYEEIVSKYSLEYYQAEFLKELQKRLVNDHK